MPTRAELREASVRIAPTLAALNEHRFMAHYNDIELAQKAAYIAWLNEVPESEDTRLVRDVLRQVEHTGSWETEG